MKIIGIIGSRKRDSVKDFLKVQDVFLEIYKEGDWICSGGCSKGADAFAETISRTRGIPILIFHSNWNKYGKGAGLVRNIDIAQHSTILIARVRKDRKGGTEDTIKKFKRFHPESGLILVED